MVKLRCKETSLDSFYGNFLYEQKVDRVEGHKNISKGGQHG